MLIVLHCSYTEIKILKSKNKSSAKNACNPLLRLSSAVGLCRHSSLSSSFHLTTRTYAEDFPFDREGLFSATMDSILQEMARAWKRPGTWASHLEFVPESIDQSHVRRPAGHTPSPALTSPACPTVIQTGEWNQGQICSHPVDKVQGPSGKQIKKINFSPPPPLPLLPPNNTNITCLAPFLKKWQSITMNCCALAIVTREY